MKKKLWIALFALISSFSVGYAFYNREMSAATSYNSGGNITGRINKMPSGLTSSTSGMQKGDKILMNVVNPYTSDKLTWQLISYQTYSDYGCTTKTTCTGNPSVSNWLALSDDPVGKLTYANSTNDFIAASGWRFVNHANSNAYPSLTSLNALIQNSPKDAALIRPRNLTFVHDIYSTVTNANKAVHFARMIDHSVFSAPATMTNSVFMFDYYESLGRWMDGTFGGYIGNKINISSADRTFSEKYMTSTSYHDGGGALYFVYGIEPSNGNQVDFNANKNNAINTPYAIRPSVYLNLDNTVFAVSKGTSSGLGNVKLTQLSANYSSLYNETKENTALGKNVPMKLRIYNSKLTAALHDIQDVNHGTKINKIQKNKHVKLSVTANAGNDGNGGLYTVSALVFDQNNTFKYYIPLESAKGKGSYEFDLTGIPAGKYKIGIVNEAYNDNSSTPADSSLITATLPLEIAEPLTITASSVSGLEYGKNVNQNDTVATYSTSNGASPITATLESDSSVSGHSNDYQLFSLNNGKVAVKHASGLNAGDYYFKIKAVDSNGDPNGGVYTNTIHVNVAKTDAAIVFDDPNETKKSAVNAMTSWFESATATPSTGTRIIYDISGGKSTLISIDSDTGEITYTRNGDYGKVEIRATVDDDPSTGYDNYNAKETRKEIFIYREVDANVIPDGNSSNATVPTFSASDANVKTNGTIGTIIGTKGTPDDGTSGGTTYSYEIKSGVGDGNLFHVDKNSGLIQVAADLGVKSYSFTITVSDKYSSKDINVYVNVGMAPAEDLSFYETSAAIHRITKKSVKATDTNVVVYATVKGSTNTNQVRYKIKDETTNVIEVNPISGAITIHGVGMVTIVAEKDGENGQAKAEAELEFTVTAGEQTFIYVDQANNELPKSGSNYAVYKETYAPSKTFQLYTTGNPTGSSVTYQLKAGSPNDVISVDPSGLVTILNASDAKETRSVIVQATSHDPSGNYNDKTIELPIEIEKGTRTIAFADDPLRVSNGKGSITPNILSDGVIDTSGTAMIEVDVSEDNSIAWTSDGITIQYSWNDVNGKDIKLHVTKPADRNYKEAKADGTLHILGADESSLTINSPGKITYGDHFTIRSTQDDSASSNVQYSFTSDNAVFISAPTVSGNKAEFDAIGNSGNTEITITVTRTADGEVPLSKTVKIKVLPKPITIEIEDKTKKRLEDNPPLTFQDITPQLVSWGGVKDNVDTSVLSLSTTAKKYSPIGSYPITCKNYTTLNDNYPNYIFTLKDGLLNVTDNGNKDFWDIDDDGCPDLNIQIKNEDGSYTTINGDVNEDGIPDYNIDSNGDGKPDLNIDTDKDGKPDVNLVILKEWKPTKCVTLDDIQFSSGITAKAQINIDLDGDLIPDIDIDTNGDFKADFNIDTDNDGKANVNIGTVHTPWTPDKDYKYQGFAYDSDTECKPYLNIDTDGDGRPDLNLDLDDDGKPDINIDIDGDFIPDTNIDSTGDGKADINVDTDADGTPNENIIEITEWKPEHNVDQPFKYDTMKINSKTQLEDNGVTVEKPNGDPFLPNMALKVTDVTEEKKNEVSEKATELIKADQEVKQVYDVKLLENGVEVKPDGTLKIRIPISEGYTNPILLKQKENGEYETIKAALENGYLVYESDELGIVAIIADIMEEKPDSEVKGNYYPGNNMGGALTGDTTDMMKYINMGCVSLGLIILMNDKKKQTG